MKNKIWIYVTIALLCLVVSITPRIFKTRAQAEDIHIKAEVSTDNGATWHNYYDSESAKGETLTVNPSDTVLMRVKIWNDGVAGYTVIGTGWMTNASYIGSVSIVSLDTDGNTREFEGYFFGDATTGQIEVDPGGSEANAESLTASIILADSFPAGQTTIEGIINITNVTAVAFNPYHKIFGTSSAFAQEYPSSSFRLAINQELPQTGADL